MADAVAAALQQGNDNNPTRVTFVTDRGSLTVPSNEEATASTGVAVTFDDGLGMTWAEIAGASGLVDGRVAQGDAAPTRAVKAMPVADGTTVSAYYSDGNEPSVGTSADGAEAADYISYKGIPGMLYCGGSDCEVAAPASGSAAADRRLEGSWYFTTLQDNADTSYVLNEATTTVTDDYTAETLYARYGHWLTLDQVNVTVHAYGVAGADDITDSLQLATTDDAANGFPGSTASYTGGASGMSVRREFGTRGEETGIASGPFAADVSLLMKFGSEPKLSGTISNFRGSAVDSSWSVSLEETGFAGAAFTEGVTNEDPNTDAASDVNEGTWTAQAYGADNKRPTGVFGVFDAYFTNGSMAGGYAARKQ